MHTELLYVNFNGATWRPRKHCPLWYGFRKENPRRRTGHFVTMDTSVFPPSCILVESANFLRSYLVYEIKICYVILNGKWLPAFRGAFYLYLPRSSSRHLTAWTRRWIYWKCLYVFTNENDVTAETTWIFRNTRVPKISHCFLFVKMSSCCCLVWTVEILLAVASLCEGKWAKWIPEWIF